MFVVLTLLFCLPAQNGIFQRLFDAANENKWLWAVYAVAILLPIMILSVWLCPTKGPGVKVVFVFCLFTVIYILSMLANKKKVTESNIYFKFL